MNIKIWRCETVVGRAAKMTRTLEKSKMSMTFVASSGKPSSGLKADAAEAAPSSRDPLRELHRGVDVPPAARRSTSTRCTPSHDGRQIRDERGSPANLGRRTSRSERHAATSGPSCAVDTVQTFDIPDEPFLKLIEANRIDQRKTRHETFQDLLHYCDHSANPCGRLVLYAFGVRDPESQRLADFTCTALQLVNFWQDLAVDWTKGRVYIPQADLRRFGYSEDDLAGGVANDRFKELMQFECARTRDFFERGLPLADRLRGAARFDVRLFSRGGMRVLDLIERAGYDVFRRRPTLSKLGKARLALETVLGIGP
jgi:squalene synthase HpnC